MTERVGWEDLPDDLRKAVEARTGPVLASGSVTSGFNCSVALVLHTHRAGRLFLKGVRTSDDAGVAGLRCEERINAAVGGIGPTIRYRFETTGWVCLAFAHIDGRHVDYGPGTRDLEAVARTLRRMHRLRTPRVPVPQLPDRFAGHLRPGEADALRGTHLLHTDTNPHNVLIDEGGHAHVIDWAMPALGPAWVDAAYTATWLMTFGQDPGEAMTWLSGIPSWQQANPPAVEAFVTATCSEFTASVGEAAAAASNSRFRHLLDALGS
ncbi:phosphotransferase [Streptomyces yaizuensis]|uniref:Phosphotransferase n=1 Tax=Streptomyces yaizuensis TaxID=2989713 RepID=A0ABQ5P4N4_9ACTN|nr:phosphotransferase [Streptomyces sp. YSPA8]GLF97477.1 phosphotransferase [Streptomyces sp. YSPA8]